MTALTDRHDDPEFSSNYSLPATNNPYRDTKQKSQPTQSGSHNSSLTHEHSSKQGTLGASAKSKPVKPNVVESFSSSSDSDN